MLHHVQHRRAAYGRAAVLHWERGMGLYGVESGQVPLRTAVELQSEVASAADGPQVIPPLGGWDRYLEADEQEQQRLGVRDDPRHAWRRGQPVQESAGNR